MTVVTQRMLVSSAYQVRDRVKVLKDTGVGCYSERRTSDCHHTEDAGIPDFGR